MMVYQPIDYGTCIFLVQDGLRTKMMSYDEYLKHYHIENDISNLLETSHLKANLEEDGINLKEKSIWFKIE